MKLIFFRKLIFFLFTLFSLTSLCYGQQNKKDKESPFELNLFADTAIFTIGTAETFTSLLIPKIYNFEKRADNLQHDLDDLNSAERKFARQYSKALDLSGDVACGAGLVFPAGVFAAAYLNKSLSGNELVKTAVMYAQSFLLTQGTSGLLKMAVLRTRPFMYFDNWEEAGAENGDAHFSFPSSHVADTFCAATFVSYTFWQYFPDSKWKWGVIASSYTIAAGTGILRVLSGNHFPTDVLAGAAIGSFFGFAVPFVHKKIIPALNNKDKGLTSINAGINSLSFTFKF